VSHRPDNPHNIVNDSLKIWYGWPMKTTISLCAMLVLLVVFACNDKADTYSGVDAGPPVDAGGDSDTDTDTDADSDSDVDPCQEGAWSGDYQITSATSLADLADYTSVTGDLWIGESMLSGLYGLECLESIGGALTIIDNEALVDMNDLLQLTVVGGNLTIDSNPSLPTLDGLANLETLGGDQLNIRFNYCLLPEYAEAFHDQLVEAGWEGDASIHDNDADGGC